jgi:hypothetical protein
VLALAAACAVAISPTTTIPGSPTGLPHGQPAPNTTDPAADAMPPPLPTGARTSTATNQHDNPTPIDPPATTSSTTQIAPTTSTSKPAKGNGKQGNEGADKTNGKKNGQN